jgi:hypothetical protein
MLMTDADIEADIKDAAAIVAAIKPHLAGHPSQVQGAALSELVSILLAGHPDYMREDMLSAHLSCVRNLVPISEHELFGDAGHPSNRGQ